MIVALSPDDLVYDFKGNKKKPKLKDFPALDSDILGPNDVVIYRYQDLNDPGEEVTVVLKGPSYPQDFIRTIDHLHGMKP